MRARRKARRRGYPAGVDVVATRAETLQDAAADYLRGSRPMKDVARQYGVTIASLNRAVRRVRGAEVPTSTSAAAPGPIPVAASPQASAPPGGSRQAADPAKAAADAARIMQVQASSPHSGGGGSSPPPPPPPPSPEKKADYCVERIQVIKLGAAWVIARRYGIDTDRDPIPFGIVKLSDAFEAEIRLNSEFLYPYLSALSGPWALAVAGVVETVALVSSLKSLAPRKKNAQDAEKGKADPLTRTDGQANGWAPAGSEAPAAEMK